MPNSRRTTSRRGTKLGEGRRRVFRAEGATQAEGAGGAVVTEILTIDELAQMLKLSRGQVTHDPAEGTTRIDNPLPTFRLNGNIRFRKSDIEAASAWPMQGSQWRPNEQNTKAGMERNKDKVAGWWRTEPSRCPRSWPHWSACTRGRYTTT